VLLGTVLYLAAAGGLRSLLLTNRDILDVNQVAERLRDGEQPLMKYLRSRFTLGDADMLMRYGNVDGATNPRRSR